jgi:hypothetical protein
MLDNPYLQATLRPRSKIAWRSQTLGKASSKNSWHFLTASARQPNKK